MKSYLIMRSLNLNIFSTKLWVYGFLIILATWFIFWKYKNTQRDKEYAADCARERGMNYEGVVHNYSTDIFDEISTFTLDYNPDTLKIPRSAKELSLENDDTIIKPKGRNVYIIKRSRDNRIDTIQFECR